jgi:outer membrane protein assembly factor BamD
MQNKMKYLVVILLSVVLVSSCGNYQRTLKGLDMKAKYETAVQLYNKQDYYRALQLFEELINVYKGTENAEMSYYYYTYCTYHVDDYIMAAYHFNSFITSYPNSKYAEEMQFMFAYCFYKDSPKSNLDQTNTLDAIEKFQLFINKYPQSAKVVEANQHIDELRLKLETKEFDIAKQFYRTENYKSAIFAFNNLLKNYPNSTYKEESYYLSLRSSYIYASKSVKTKQLERYKESLEHYYKLVDNFPQSKYLRESEKLYENAMSAISKQTSSTQ